MTKRVNVCPCCDDECLVERLRTQVTETTHAYLCPYCHEAVTGEFKLPEAMGNLELARAFVAKTEKRDEELAPNGSPAVCGKCGRTLSWVDLATTLVPLILKGLAKEGDLPPKKEDLRCLGCHAFEEAEKKIQIKKEKNKT